MKFNIGDRIIVTKPTHFSQSKLLGMRGTIIEDNVIFNVYYVKFDHIDTKATFVYNFEIELDTQYYREEKLNKILK